MSSETFALLDELQQSEGPAAAINQLIETLRGQKEYHRLFDALLLKKRYELGLPLARPTTLDDVPEDRREAFEEFYVEAAREIGRLLLDDGQIAQAWVYFRTIREPAPVAQALEAVDPRREFDDATEELISVALYEGANPAKGLEIMLHTHGTCNTVTALDQTITQISPEDRKRAAAMLVRTLYEDLSHTLRHEVQQRLAAVPPGDALRELFTNRDWLFEAGNYHIDVSHLNAVVRFARFLDGSCPELEKAIELAEYGSKLDRQFQYAGDPPFDDFYPAHVQFFNVLADRHREDALNYFREKLAAEPDEQDKQIIAYVITDLLLRVGRDGDAVEVAEQHLKNIEESGFSFSQLCQQAGRMDILQRVAREKGDLVGYTAAIVQNGAAAAKS